MLCASLVISRISDCRGQYCLLGQGLLLSLARPNIHEYCLLGHCDNSGHQKCSRMIELRLSNATITLDQRPTFSPRCDRPSWEASWPVCKVLWSITSACASVPGRVRYVTASVRATANPGFTHGFTPYIRYTLY